MNSAAIRNHLYSFIKVADQNQLKAIYSIVKSDVQQNAEWWKNKDLIADLKKEYEELHSGKSKGYSIDEVFTSYEKMKKKKLQK